MKDISEDNAAAIDIAAGAPTSARGDGTTDCAVVVLAGGAGTRFWPLSTQDKPKQFLTLLGDRSLLQTGYRLASLIAPSERILVLTNEAFVPLVREQLPDLPHANIIGEPVRRDTAAAICLGALICRERFGDMVMVVLTADHRIAPSEEFARVINSAATAAASEPVLYTLGIPPTYPATAYGYLRQGAKVRVDGDLTHYSLLGFREKPDLATAEEYVAAGEYWWNSGMFVWGTDVILSEYHKNLPGHLAVLEAVPLGGGAEEIPSAALREAFASLPSVSVDYGVMEHAANVRMIGATFEWSDLGGWVALEEYLPADDHGNHFRGRLATLDARANIVFCADPGELVALVGVDDLIVVRAGRRTLVVPRWRAEEIRQLVAQLEDDR
ncbi:MAG: mannose-1-phosphate guanylyltransferase [Actinobacteria bacterium]|nr:mannose-1-phosphate guanylyltransferase [Actinomycetota bacterium]